jgi:hypothetical protein
MPAAFLDLIFWMSVRVVLVVAEVTKILLSEICFPLLTRTQKRTIAYSKFSSIRVVEEIPFISLGLSGLEIGIADGIRPFSHTRRVPGVIQENDADASRNQNPLSTGSFASLVLFDTRSLLKVC